MKSIAVVFDVEGVLCDGAKHWRAVGSSFLRQIVPSWSDADQRSIFGKSIYQVYELLKEQRGLALSWEQFMVEYRALALDIYGVRAGLFPGVQQCLLRLRGSQIPLGICSSLPHDWIDALLSRYELSDFFREVVSGDDMGVEVKPSPNGYQLIVQKLQLPAANVVAVEDSSKGVRSAKAAGLRCIGFRNGINDELDFGEADMIVDNLEEVSAENLVQLVQQN